MRDSKTAPLNDAALVYALDRPAQPGAPHDLFIGIPRKAWMRMIKSKAGFSLDVRNHGVNLRVMVFARGTQDECRAQLVRKEPDETSREGE